MYIYIYIYSYFTHTHANRAIVAHRVVKSYKNPYRNFYKNPPRPCASWRVEPQPQKTNPQIPSPWGGVYPSPTPPRAPRLRGLFEGPRGIICRPIASKSLKNQWF